MYDANAQIDVAAERAWLMQHKADTGLPWKSLADQSGIAAGTISAFGPGTYRGDNDAVALAVRRYRETTETQAELASELPLKPGFQATKTSDQIHRLLRWAHMGRLIVLAGGPGIGKSTVAANYARSASNVFLATMSESTSGLNPMQIEVLTAMGEPDPRGAPHQLSRRIGEKVKDKNALIIIDEANKLSEKAIEEARSWHDRTGVGLAFVGTDGIITRLEGGSRHRNYAQLYSRIDMKMVREVPLAEDAAKLAAAWGVTDTKELEFLIALGTKPGGLRSLTKVMELSSMLSFDDGQRTLTHLRAAWAQLSTRPMAA